MHRLSALMKGLYFQNLIVLEKSGVQVTRNVLREKMLPRFFRGMDKVVKFIIAYDVIEHAITLFNLLHCHHRFLELFFCLLLLPDPEEVITAAHKPKIIRLKTACAASSSA